MEHLYTYFFLIFWVFRRKNCQILLSKSQLLNFEAFQFKTGNSHSNPTLDCKLFHVSIQILMYCIKKHFSLSSRRLFRVSFMWNVINTFIIYWSLLFHISQHIHQILSQILLERSKVYYTDQLPYIPCFHRRISNLYDS